MNGVEMLLALDYLHQLKDEIENDLKGCTDVDYTATHLKALNAVEVLIDYYL